MGISFNRYEMLSGVNKMNIDVKIKYMIATYGSSSLTPEGEDMLKEVTYGVPELCLFFFPHPQIREEFLQEYNGANHIIDTLYKIVLWGEYLKLRESHYSMKFLLLQKRAGFKWRFQEVKLKKQAQILVQQEHDAIVNAKGEFPFDFFYNQDKRELEKK